MAKDVLLICSCDREYADRLSAYIWKKWGSHFEVRAYTRAETVEDYFSGACADIVLMTEDFYKSTEGRSAREGFPEGLTFLLTEEREVEAAGVEAIFRYSNTDSIIERLARAYTERFGKREDEGCRVIAVYSPVKRSGRTSYAIRLAKEAGQRAASVFITFEDICGHRELEEKTGLSELFYEYAAKGELSESLPEPPEEGTVFIAPAACPEDIRLAGPENAAGIIAGIRDSGKYRTVIIDVGDGLRDELPVLAEATEIHIPIGFPGADAVCERKLELWQGIIKKKSPEIYHRVRQVRTAYEYGDT